MKLAAWLDQQLCLKYGEDQVYFYPRSNPAAENFQQRMVLEMEGCSKTLAVLSENYFSSQAGLAEGMEALSQDWLGQERRLLWVTFEKVRLRPFFAGRVGLQLQGVYDPQTRAEALLAYVDSAITGKGYGGTPFVVQGFRGESLPISDHTVGPEARSSSGNSRRT